MTTKLVIFINSWLIITSLLVGCNETPTSQVKSETPNPPTATVLPTTIPQLTINQRHSNATHLKSISIKPEALAQYSRFVETTITQHNIPGAAIAIVQGDEILLAQGFGVKNIETGEPVTPESLFHIGSTNKSLTAMLIATLIEDGLFTWDTPIVDIYPDFYLANDEATKQVTMRHLLSMRAGIDEEAEYELGFEDSTAEDVFYVLEETKLIGEPEAVFSYSNLSYAAAGYVAVLAVEPETTDFYTGYANLLQTRLLIPLGMNKATVWATEAQANPNYAWPHTIDKTGNPILAESYDVDGDALAPSGVLKANVLDMATYLSTQLNRGIAPNGNRILSETVITEMWQPYLENYGLGWEINQSNDITIISHEGAYDNFLSLIGFMPDLNIGFVILTNSEDTAGPLIEEAPQQLISLLEESIKSKPHPQVTKPTKQKLGQTNQPTFEPTTCPFDEPDEGIVTCGTVNVPQNRAQPNGKQVTLAIAILHAQADDPEPDPIFYFEGGPGGMALSDLEIWIENGYNANRDIILFDQRGTGYSIPDLNCPEFDDEDDWVKAAKQCKNRLQKRQVDLSQYNSAISATDFNEIHQALGYGDQPVNLFGISYGTRLALTVMRDYPDNLRSVILDSVYPPNVDGYQVIAETDRVFNRFFEGCTQDSYCAEYYPDLKSRFYTMVTKLNEEPVDLEDYEYLITGDDMISLLYDALYDTNIIPSLPWVFYEASQGNFTPYIELENDYYGYNRQQKQATFLSAITKNNTPDGDSEGMNYSVQCYEELPFSNYDAVIAEAEAYPHLTNYMVDQFVEEWAICDLWDVGIPPSLENEAVYSNVPTLILAGEYDPTTPFEWANLAAQTLAYHYKYQFPGQGHGLTLNMGCATEITLNFLDTPTVEPDTDCLADIPNPPVFE